MNINNFLFFIKFIAVMKNVQREMKIKRIKLIIQTKSEQMLAYYHIDEDT